MGYIRKQFLYIYYGIRNYWPVWTWLNREGKRLFEKNKPVLNPVQQQIVDTLKTDGIAVTSLDELAPGENLLQVFQEYEQKLAPQAYSRSKKKFLNEYWDINPELDLNNPFVEFSLRKSVVDIANSYMGMWTKFRSYALNKTLPVQDKNAEFSQKWHRDPEEKRMCKMFIYLNDVDENAGPFIYVPKSTYGNEYGHLFPQKSPEGSYPSADKVAAVIPANEIKTMTGKAGSVIFCDTSGIHRGGHAKTKERIMYTVFFSSKTFSHLTRYTLPKDKTDIQRLSKEVQYALKTH